MEHNTLSKSRFLYNLSLICPTVSPYFHTLFLPLQQLKSLKWQSTLLLNAFQRQRTQLMFCLGFWCFQFTGNILFKEISISGLSKILEALSPFKIGDLTCLLQILQAMYWESLICSLDTLSTWCVCSLICYLRIWTKEKFCHLKSCLNSRKKESIALRELSEVKYWPPTSGHARHITTGESGKKEDSL